MLDENGMSQEMMRDATYKGLEKFGVEDATELGFEHIPLPFLLLAGGMVVALTISSCEKIFGKGKVAEQPRDLNQGKTLWNRMNNELEQ